MHYCVKRIVRRTDQLNIPAVIDDRGKGIRLNLVSRVT